MKNTPPLVNVKSIASCQANPQIIRKVFYSISLFFVAAVLFTACKKEIEAESTTINGLTFGCKVNGKPFIADRWDYGYNIPPIHIDFWWDPVEREHYFIARAEKENESIRLYLNGSMTTGIKYLNTSTSSWPCNVDPADYASYDIRYPAKEYLTNSNSTGFVNIIYADSTKNKIEVIKSDNERVQYSFFLSSVWEKRK